MPVFGKDQNVNVHRLRLEGKTVAANPLIFKWHPSYDSIFFNHIKGKLSIKTQPTTLPRIFCKCFHYSKCIFKSNTDPAYTCQ